MPPVGGRAQGSRNPRARPIGLGIDTLSIRKATFAVWLVVTGAHTLARLLPALRLTLVRQRAALPVPGRNRRIGALAATLGAPTLGAILVLGAAGAWSSRVDHHEFDHVYRHAHR